MHVRGRSLAILPSRVGWRLAGWSAIRRHSSSQTVCRGSGLPPVVDGLHPVGGVDEVLEALLLQVQFFPLQAG